jgi:hypothetical protein
MEHSMGIRNRQNGPTFGDATYKANRGPAPSPERRHAKLEDQARDCAKTRELNKDPAAWVLKNIPTKKR